MFLVARCRDQAQEPVRFAANRECGPGSDSGVYFTTACDSLRWVERSALGCPAKSDGIAIKMPRKSEFVATSTLEGYQLATVTVTNKVSTGGGVAMAGNVLVGGILGAGIDAGTGAMLDLTPNQRTWISAKSARQRPVVRSRSSTEERRHPGPPFPIE